MTVEGGTQQTIHREWKTADGAAQKNRDKNITILITNRIKKRSSAISRTSFFTRVIQLYEIRFFKLEHVAGKSEDCKHCQVSGTNHNIELSALHC